MNTHSHRPSRESLAHVPTHSGAFSLLHLARSIASSLHHGRHRSLARGGSAEFYDFRSYSPGDPLRLIDWRLFGRSDRLYLRRYQQESQISLVLVVDASESMRFAGLDMQGGTPRGVTKLRRACELAAALAYLAVKEGDRVGLVIAGRDGPPVPPRAGWPAMHEVTRALESLLSPVRAVTKMRRTPMRTSIAANTLAGGLGAAESLTHNGRGGVVIALSDALDDAPPIIAAAARLRFAGANSGARPGPRRDLAMIQILSDDELAFSTQGAARLVDHESSLEIEADLDEVADAYRAAIGEHIGLLRRALAASGSRHILATLSRAPADILGDLLRP